MFGFWKKKQPAAAEGKLGTGTPVIAALLLEGDSFPVDAFLKQLAAKRVQGKAVSGIKPDEGGVFSFSVGDEFFALAVMPAPYPASDIDGPIATTWMWPPSPPVETVKQHRSHLLITMTGGAGDPVRRRLTMTAVTALAATTSGVMAVFWPEGDAGCFSAGLRRNGRAGQFARGAAAAPVGRSPRVPKRRRDDRPVHDGPDAPWSHGNRDSSHRHGAGRTARLAPQHHVLSARQRSRPEGWGDDRHVGRAADPHSTLRVELRPSAARSFAWSRRLRLSVPGMASGVA